MEQHERDRPKRRRRRHGRRSDQAPKPVGPNGLAPIAEPRRLDLDRPVTEPLSFEEAREMSAHLLFLRTYKKQLGLSLNAVEDLLINGDKEPTDRGICKHLLSKVDRRVVEKMLARDTMKADARGRTRFLAGIVRLNRDVSFLIWYLQALAEVADRREAAAAFALTVDRIDFARLSNAQTSDLLELIVRTFEGHDRVQALFGLLGSDTFEGALDRALTEGLADHLRDIFAPLRAAHGVIMRGRAPRGDDRERALVEKGVALCLSAPDAVLRGYPPEIRTRLAEYAVLRVDPTSDASKGARSLLDSLPHDGEAYAALGLALAEQLIGAEKDEQARGILSQIAQAHPTMGRARALRDALGWPRSGKLAFAPGNVKGGGGAAPRLRQAFWPQRCAFVLVRLAKEKDRERFVEEARIQGSLLLPGVAPAVGHGSAGHDDLFVALATAGASLDRDAASSLELEDALALALDGVSILRAVALSGFELPDAALSRFLVSDGDPPALVLADLGGIVKGEPEACAIAHGKLARRFAFEVTHPNGSARSDLPPAVRARLRDTAQLAVLGRVLAEHVARVRAPVSGS